MNVKHAKYFLLIIFFPLFLLMFFQVLIDPYDIYHSPRVKNINEVKVAYLTHHRLHQAIQIAKKKPEVIFLGSSRVMSGLDPSTVEQFSNGYNCGFSGANMEEIYYYFDHALYYQPQLKLVIIGLDVFGFNKHHQPQADFSCSYLKEGTLCPTHRLLLLCSKGAVKDAWKTFTKNLFQTPLSPFLLNGLYNPSITIRPIEDSSEKDLAYLQSVFQSKEYYSDYEIDEKKLDYFKKIVEICQAKNIDLQIFFNPSQAIYWEAMYRKMGTMVEKLKQKLVEIHPIWDFSGFNCITTQSLHVSSPLYFECSHYTPYTGSLILKKILVDSLFLPDFGYLLTPKNIDSKLLEIQNDRKEWLKSCPPCLEKLTQIM